MGLRADGNALLVVIPTYDERETLPVTVRRVLRELPEADILVVDDSSPDGTGEWAREASEAEPRLSVLSRDGKGGLAGAYRDGLAWGLDAGYPFLAQMDADGSHRARDLVKLYARMFGPDDPDMAIGSRWVAGGRTEDWTPARIALSRAGNAYVRAMLGLRTRDATAGFRVHRAQWLAETGVLDVIASRGYSFQMELTMRAEQVGAVVVEVPVDFRERDAGESKLSMGIAWEELRLVTSWGLDRVLGNE